MRTSVHVSIHVLALGVAAVEAVCLRQSFLSQKTLSLRLQHLAQARDDRPPNDESTPARAGREVGLALVARLQRPCVEAPAAEVGVRSESEVLRRQEEVMQRLAEQVTATVVRELGLSDEELHRLQFLSESLRRALESAQGSDAGEAEIQRASSENERELRQLLGPERAHKLDDLRRQHPEYGRFIAALLGPYEMGPADGGSSTPTASLEPVR